jgi:hypothetical protein
VCTIVRKREREGRGVRGFYIVVGGKCVEVNYGRMSRLF